MSPFRWPFLSYPSCTTPCRVHTHGFRAAIFVLKVHHVLKDHPYRKLALSLRRSSTSPASAPSVPSPRGSNHDPSGPRVLGLTASYTYSIGDAKVEASLRSMCAELLVTNTESATPEELRTSGYHAVGAAAEVSLAPTLSASSSSVPLGVVPQAIRKPHDMIGTFFGREGRGKNTAFTRRLMVCVRAMEAAVVAASEHPGFASPLPPLGKLAPREWGAYVHKLAYGDGTNGSGGGVIPTASNPKRGQCSRCGSDAGKLKIRGKASASRAADCNGPPAAPARPMLAELEHWYEAVKTLLVSWEEAEDEAATILDMGGCDIRRKAGGRVGAPPPPRGQFVERRGGVWPEHVREAISAFWAEVPTTFPRYEHLKEVLKEKYALHGGSGSGGEGSFRGIIFVRQRVTTHVLAHVISSDPAVAPMFSPACLYASTSPATASLSVPRGQAQAHIESFREGRVNLLVATVVAEEGMDIPAANCTIRFDAMEHAVSLVQGRGRARQVGSSFVVLRERADRTTADLEAAEQEQLRLVHKFKTAASLAPTAADDKILAAQRSRERGARSSLLSTGAESSSAGTSDPTLGALAAVNLFARRTKVTLEDGWKKAPNGLWVCTLTYESPLRELHATGKAAGKKTAKKLAATKLLEDLLELVPA